MSEEATQENSRDRQARDTKARLIAVALTLFAQNGVAGTSIKDIAREAGVAQGLLYHYFAGKDDLLWGVLEENTFLPHLQEICGNAEGQAAEDVLREVALRFDAYLASQQTRLRLILGELQFNSRVQTLWEESIRREESILQEFLRGRVQCGELRAHDVQVTARMLMYGVVLLYLPGGRTVKGNPAFLRDMAATLVRGIAAEEPSPR